VEVEYVKGTLCQETRLLEFKGYKRGGEMSSGDTAKIQFHPCAEENCECDDFRASRYQADTLYQLCESCPHSATMHGRKEELTHVIACDAYRVTLPVDPLVETFQGVTRGDAEETGTWGNVIVFQRDFMFEDDQEQWSW